MMTRDERELLTQWRGKRSMNLLSSEEERLLRIIDNLQLELANLREQLQKEILKRDSIAAGKGES